MPRVLWEFIRTLSHPISSHPQAMSHPLASPSLSAATSADLADRDVEAFRDEGKLTAPAVTPPPEPTHAGNDDGHGSATRQPDFLARALTSSSFSDRDPLLLKSKIQSDAHITELRHRKQAKSKHVLGDFYSRQNQQITSLLKSMDDHIQSAQDDEDQNRTAIKIAINGSLIANICLAVLQIYAAVSSLSLSFFATAIDAVFDPMANGVLYYCHKKGEHVDLRDYPSGGSKFETIGDIVYSGVMGSVSVILVAFSIQDLVKGDPGDKTLHIPAAVVVGIAFLTKLALFLYCFSIRGKNSQVRVLWEDHRNDLFINGFGLFTSCAGFKIKWWIDPMGALIISVVLIFVWGQTCYGHFTFLAGKAAPIEFQQLVIYKAMTFAEGIEKIDSCVVYHSGPDYIVEVDIVMSAETPLWKAHDVSQALQDKLEDMPRVSRCHVHVDYETTHKPEHRKVR
ncbi:hypothetical protein T439DRAFT_324824 [Meredithblackwellia eburnea MCA 4105]